MLADPDRVQVKELAAYLRTARAAGIDAGPPISDETLTRVFALLPVPTELDFTPAR